MKNFILSLLLLVVYLNAWSGNITRTYNVSFDSEEFTFSYDVNGYLQISSDKDFCYSERNEPGLPLIPYEIALDGQYSYVSSNVRYNKRLIRSNVTVQQSPMPLISDLDSEVLVSNDITYSSDTIFPNENFIYSAQSRWSDFSVFRFLVCPFVYDAKEKSLYFIDSFSIDMTVSQDEVEMSRNLFGKIPAQMRQIYGHNVENAAKDIQISMSMDNNSDDSNIEYVIITADSLKQAFEPLMNWKRTKGLKSKILSIEEIYSSYPGVRNSVKLKKCLFDLYKNKGLVYVLLGGDDTIVPVQGCYSRVPKSSDSDYVDDSIPSDIFYACFDGDFEWDGNNNGIFGEIDDDINFTQYICVTRVPIRTSIDATSFISKLLTYEQNPNWSNRMLMCGTKLWRYMQHSTQSDAEAKGDNLYANYIQPYWNGKRFKFYDTATDFADGENYNLTNLNLANQLSDGYDFVDIITHGGQTVWSMEAGSSYSSSHGKKQTNIGSTIVTTMSCNTNAFDTSVYPGKSDPCLSESLIRNPLSGVIAYLGCSRYGWGYSGNDQTGGSSQLGPSLQYESKFYKHLFNRDYENLNFGMLV
ncbi:MAG: hypothetical protein K2I45_10785, partial [Muribaculaceae bacterium]|nr:hypothetical protein [Muribaculaceae bacterium]